MPQARANTYAVGEVDNQRLCRVRTLEERYPTVRVGVCGVWEGESTHNEMDT